MIYYFELMKIIPNIMAEIPITFFIVMGSSGKFSQPKCPAITENKSCPHNPKEIIFAMPSLGIV
jgi:hypothetical protein